MKAERALKLIDMTHKIAHSLFVRSVVGVNESLEEFGFSDRDIYSWSTDIEKLIKKAALTDED